MCDKRKIPTVTDASYTMAEGDTRGNFALPGSVKVTYTCHKGFELQYPQNSSISCEYVTKPESESQDVITKAMWTSTDRSICAPGQYISPAFLGLITCGREPPWEIKVCQSSVRAGSFTKMYKSGAPTNRKYVLLTLYLFDLQKLSNVGTN